MKVTAQATRSGGWWAVTVPEVAGAFTQARRLDQVPAMVRDAVALLTGADEDTIEVELKPVTDVDDELVSVTALRRAAERAADDASTRTRALVGRLSSEGFTVRDVATLLQVSPQRVSQLAARAHNERRVISMAKGDVDTYYEDGQWKNKVEGNSRASSVHDTKADAQTKGRDMAREHKVEHVIKNKDGAIGKGSSSKQSYGKDPRSSKG